MAQRETECVQPFGEFICLRAGAIYRGGKFIWVAPRIHSTRRKANLGAHPNEFDLELGQFTSALDEFGSAPKLIRPGGKLIYQRVGLIYPRVGTSHLYLKMFQKTA